MRLLEGTQRYVLERELHVRMKKEKYRTQPPLQPQQKLDQRVKKRGKKRLIKMKNAHPAMPGPDAQ